MSQRTINIGDRHVLPICEAFNLKMLAALWPGRVECWSQKVEWDSGHNYTQIYRQPVFFHGDDHERAGRRQALVTILRRIDRDLRRGERLLDTSGPQIQSWMGGAHEYDDFSVDDAQLVFFARRDLMFMHNRMAPDETPQSEFLIECSLRANRPWLGNDLVASSRCLALAFDDESLVRV